MIKEEVIIRIPKILYDRIMEDMKRPHEFAFERIGFITACHKKLDGENVIVFVTDYKAVEDNEYIPDNKSGARINSVAIRKAIQNVIDKQVGCFHVHHHEISLKIPQFSTIDLKDNPEIIKSFSYANKDQVHGMLVTGDKGLNALVLLPGRKTLISASKIVIVGYPMSFSFPEEVFKKIDSKRYDRQSFLGKNSQYLFSKIRVGIVGVGGGGSHIVQQLAHLGIMNYVIFDDDITNESNLNRNIGSGELDAKKSKRKVDIAERTILHVQPKAIIIKKGKWQDSPEDLQLCDIIIGGVDSFLQRSYLESECRRYLIPLIDIGMDVHHKFKKEAPSVVGQVILSMPGYLCFRCFGFITEDNLKKEVGKYGDSGGKPQVVWSNGILASNAIGIFVDLVTGWTGKKDQLVYNSYDGNQGEIVKHKRLEYINPVECSHFLIENCGPPKFIAF